MSWTFSSLGAGLALGSAALLVSGCEAKCPSTAHLEEHDLGGLHSKVCVNSLEALDGPSSSWAVNDQKVFEGNFEVPPPRFESGNPSGVLSWWYENGNTRAKLEFSKGGAGLLEGKSRFWNHDGSRLYEVFYRQGRPDGHWLAWHPSGKTAFEGEFKDGLRTGQWRYWHADGKLGVRAEYLAGAPSGVWVAWRRDGAQALRMRFEDGKPKEVHGDEPTPDFYKTPKSELDAQFAIHFPHSVDEAYTAMDFTKSPDDTSAAITAGSIDEQILSNAFEHTLRTLGQLFGDLKTSGKGLSPFGELKGSMEFNQSGWLKFDVSR